MLPADAHQRLPAGSRLTAGARIREVLRRGNRQRTRDLDVFIAAAPGAAPRLGVIVPKHRHRIVERNLLKRRLREAGRRLLLPALRRADLRIDVILRARPTAYRSSWQDLRAQVGRVAEGLCSGG